MGGVPTGGGDGNTNLDAAKIKMPMLHELNTPQGKAVKAAMQFDQEFVLPQFSFWSGLGNQCMYVDGMASWEMGTGNSYQYDFTGWGGAPNLKWKQFTKKQIEDGAPAQNAGIFPVYDTKSFIPSYEKPIEGTGQKDKFRHYIGKDWLLYGQTVSIPSKFTEFALVQPMGNIPWYGHSPQGGLHLVEGNRYRSYLTPIDNWFVLFSEGTKDITNQPGWTLAKADNKYYNVAKEEYPVEKLVPGLANIIALRKGIFHAYYPVGMWKGQSNLFSSSTEFWENNPVFTDWGTTFNTFSSMLATSPFDWDAYSKTYPELFEGSPNTYPYYYDHHFEMQKPYNYKNVEGSFLNTPLYVKIKPHYNFTEPKYEGMISDSSVPETILPNMYVFLSETQLNNLDPNLGFNPNIDPMSEGVKAKQKPKGASQYLEIMTLGGNLPNVFVDVLNEKGEKTGEKQKKPYFSMWIDKYGDIAKEQPGVIDAHAAKLLNIGICQSDISLLKDYNEKEQMFPMAMEIEFSTDQNTEFAEMLDKHKLGKALMLELMERTTAELTGDDTSLKTEPFVHASSKQPALIDDNGNLDVNHAKPFISLNANYVETMDLDQWFMDLKLASYNKETPANAIFIGMEEGDKTPKDMSVWKKFLLVNKFGINYKQFVKKKFRKDIDLTFNGARPAYNETLYYRIEKKIGNQIIQNIYLPNSSKTGVLKYYDTQVKYGVDYTYKIYAYQLVVGTRYAYSKFITPIPEQLTEEYIAFNAYDPALGDWGFDMEEIPWNPWWGHAYVDYEPCTKILEIPWYEFTQTMVDNPPPPPDVDFVPYRGIKDEILINMTENNGEYLMHPVSIDSTDEDQHNLIRKALQVPKGEPILYKGDDPVIAYEVYRTTTKPKRYEDFADKLIKTVDTIKEGTSLRDKLQPNTKYYYIIRAIDRHFHFSNPSAIFEVELISDSIQNVGGLMELTGLTAVKPRVKICELDNKIEKSLFKPMRKYLRILPVMEQTMLSDEEKPKSAYDDKKIKLGLTDASLFGGQEGRKFKIRLTSKKTGKKMDVNIDFRLKYEKVNKQDLEEHLPSLYDVAYSDLDMVLDELSGEVANSVLAQSAKITTDFNKSSAPMKSIVEAWGMGGFSASSMAQITNAITGFKNIAKITSTLNKGGGNGGSGGASSGY